MDELPNADDEAELALNRVLRNLPLRHAPATLESRVLEQLERLGTLPWWRRGFAHWPRTARAAFVAICCAVIGLTVLDGSWLIGGARIIGEIGGLSVSWAYPTIAVFSSAAEVAALLLRAIPLPWLYGSLAACALLYAALFGLGAAAYRSLYLQSPAAGDLP